MSLGGTRLIRSSLLLAKVKIGSFSLGVTWILFVGIVASHFGLVLDPETSHFVKEFGLILFIYSIGIQVGPGIFISFSFMAKALQDILPHPSVF